jgi:hypothetical protein
MATPLRIDGVFASARLGFTIALAGLLGLAAVTFGLSRRSARLLGAVTVSADASAAPPGR